MTKYKSGRISCFVYRILSTTRNDLILLLYIWTSVFLFEYSIAAAVLFVLLSLLMFVFAIAEYVSFHIMSMSMFVISIIANLIITS